MDHDIQKTNDQALLDHKDDFISEENLETEGTKEDKNFIKKNSLQRMGTVVSA